MDLKIISKGIEMIILTIIIIITDRDQWIVSEVTVDSVDQDKEEKETEEEEEDTEVEEIEVA